MNIHKDPRLDEREFGRAAVRVEDLRTWTTQARALLPPTVPSLDECDAVQLEALLVAMGRGAREGSDNAVLAAATALLNDETIPAGHPKTKIMIVEEQDVVHARWFLGAEVHRQWRQKLEQAIARGELETFDALTGLPLATTKPAPFRHSTKEAQRDEADVFIDAALAECGAGADVATVWAYLQKIADDKTAKKPGTLIGLDDDGLKYTKNGVVDWLNREALRKRLKRRQAP